MPEIIDIPVRQEDISPHAYDIWAFSGSPDLQPDDILFVFCSWEGSQGDNSNYIVTYTGVVYRLSIHELWCNDFMHRICPFLKDLDYDSMPDLELLLTPDSRFKFRRDDWCWIPMAGRNNLFIHATMAEDFAHATKNLSQIELYKKWVEVAVGLVEQAKIDTYLTYKGLMIENSDLDRFLVAQETPFLCGYKHALEEMKNGKKQNHWIWYIFPQLRCLGRSSRAYYYGIADRYEAGNYLSNFILGGRIRNITKELLKHKDKTAFSIFGDIDAVKVRSCMTMFDFLSPNDIFGEVLDSFYNGERCESTLKAMNQECVRY